MNENDLCRRLIAEMMDSGLSAEQVCRDHPELLAEVERRWRSVVAIRKELDTLFPAADSVDPTPPAPPASAPQFPGYDQVEFIGRGGMGVVYRARHTALNRFVAIKMLLPRGHEAPHEAEALLREASAVAAIQHPHIVQVFDVGTFEGRPYFTMELLKDGSLAQRMGGAPQAPRTAAEMTALLAAAVQVAHDRGIVHRDLKPGNILLATDGTPKIADFGLARRIAGDPTATLGQAGFGTPSYMAPEQALGAAGRNQPAVDIYALGAVLYDLLTGRPPWNRVRRRGRGSSAGYRRHIRRTSGPALRWPSRCRPRIRTRSRSTGRRCRFARRPRRRV
jgi:serine/threonine protein kinase